MAHEKTLLTFEEMVDAGIITDETPEESGLISGVFTIEPGKTN